MKITLDSNDVELALNTASKRFIGNLKMGKGFSYGYQGDYRKQLADSFLGALGEVAYAKSQNKYFNSSYTDNLQRYSDSDFQNNIEIRTQEKKDYNFLLIRPGEKKGKDYCASCYFICFIGETIESYEKRKNELEERRKEKYENRST